MKRLVITVLIIFAALLAPQARAAMTADGGTSTGLVYVVFETEKGNLTLEIDTKHAPITGGGFLKYVDAGAYTGGSFHRSVKRDKGYSGSISIVQADVARGKQSLFPPFRLESTKETGITHTTGTLSMPRGSDLDSGSSGISIMMGESHLLDNGVRDEGYATFGHVYSGWAALNAIHDSPGRASGGGRRGGRRGRGARNGQTSGTMTQSATPTPVPTPARVRDETLMPAIAILGAHRLPGVPPEPREVAK